MAMVGLLSLAVAALVASELSRDDSRRRADEQIRDQTKTIATDVRLSLSQYEVDLGNLSDNLINSMYALESQFGLRVGRLLQSEVNSFSSMDEDTSARMILSAKEELRILDVIAENGSWPDDSMNQDILDSVFRQIIHRAETPPHRITYRRIIQASNPSAGLHSVENETLLKHCKEILRLRQQGGRRSALRIANRRFPFKFVLIDNTGLILQLQEYCGEGNVFRLWGELQISDPGHRLIPVFREIWDQIDDANDTRHLSISDLP